MTVQHLAGPMRVDGTQVCLRCGYLVSDYRGAESPEGSPPLSGFPEGPVYVSGEFPVFSTTLEPVEYRQCSHRRNHVQ